METKISINELSKHFKIPEETLKQKTYLDLEKLQYQMETEKKEIEKPEITASFRHIVKTYLTCYNELNQYFSEEEIIQAAFRNANERSITEETLINPGCTCYKTPNEYLRTGIESVRAFDKNGRAYLECDRKRMDVYRTASQYQGLIHGPIILDLLYHRFPELIEFQYEAYEWNTYRNFEYEIYPKNNIYTPFKALMEKNIDAIKERNLSYAKAYHNGIYTPELTEKRLQSPEALHYFKVIQNLKAKD